MPRSVKIGIHRIKILRPRHIEPDDKRKAHKPSCDIQPRRSRLILGQYDTDMKHSNSTWLGSFYYRDKEIKVRSGLVDTMLERDVLMHEISHAAWDYAGLADMVPEKYEEGIVDAFARTWLALLRDNPKLVEFLTARDD